MLWNVETAMESVRRRVESAARRARIRSRPARRAEVRLRRTRALYALTLVICLPRFIYSGPYLLYTFLSASEVGSSQAGGIDECRKRLLGRCYVRITVGGSMLGL